MTERRCPDCGGSGLELEGDDWGGDVPCHRCKGTGGVAVADDERRA